MNCNRNGHDFLQTITLCLNPQCQISPVSCVKCYTLHQSHLHDLKEVKDINGFLDEQVNNVTLRKSYESIRLTAQQLVETIDQEINLLLPAQIPKKQMGLVELNQLGEQIRQRLYIISDHHIKVFHKLRETINSKINQQIDAIIQNNADQLRRLKKNKFQNTIQQQTKLKKNTMVASKSNNNVEIEDLFENYENILSTNPNDVHSLYAKGRILLDYYNAFKEAQFCFERVLSINPCHQRSIQAIEQCQKQ